jgi:hypothetical protein
MSLDSMPPPPVSAALRGLIEELEAREARLQRDIDCARETGIERVDLEHRIAWTQLHIRALRSRRPA